MSKKARRRPTWKKWAQKYYRSWEWHNKHPVNRFPNNELVGTEMYRDSIRIKLRREAIERLSKLEWE